MKKENINKYRNAGCDDVNTILFFSPLNSAAGNKQQPPTPDNTPLLNPLIMSYPSSQIEININHLRECLLRNGFVGHVAHQSGKVFHEVEDDGLLAPVKVNSTSSTSDELKHLLVVNVIRHNTHIVEQLLEDESRTTGGMFPLPAGVAEVLHALRPLFSFSRAEPTSDSKILDCFVTELSQLLEKSLRLLEQEDPFSKALKWLKEKVCFAVWCIEQSFNGSGTPLKSILELCTQQPSCLSTLKVLGGLQLVNQQDVSVFLGNSSMNVYRGYLVLSSFIQYLFRPLQQLQSSPVNLEDVDNLIKGISCKEMSLRVMEDVFSLCFLRKEDILFEETASDSGGEDKKSEECFQSKKSGDPSCPSNSNSPSNNTQTGTSSTACLAGKKGDMSLGFLCQDPDKLQKSLRILKRHLEAVEVDDDEELSLRHRKLEQRVSQALWRLQLVDHNPRMANYFSRPPQDGCAVVRKAWLARLNPSVQTWYGYSPGRRKLRSPCASHHQRKSKDRAIDPLLINRLLSDPLSLMTTSMMNSQLSAARQVADLYQLWETPEGRELHFSLAHASAVQELQRIGRQVACIENPEIEINDSALSHVRLPSAVETQLSTLQQAAVPSLTADDDWQSAVLMADLINSSTLSTPQLDVQLLNFALRKVEGTVDVNVEPWRTLKRLVDCSNYHLEHIDWPPGSFPIQSHLPFDLELLQQRASHLEAVRLGFKRLIDASQHGGCAPDAFDSALEDLNQHLQPLENHSTTPLLRMKRYLHHLRQLIPSRLREGSAAFLLEEHHAGVLIVERLREDPEAIEQIETIARSIGIELPSFLAECLCTIPDSGAKKLVDLSDREFVLKLMNYLHAHSPLLAQVVELQLQTEHGFQGSSVGERVNIEAMAVFRRYLQRPSKAGQKELAISPPIMIRPPKRPVARPLPDSPSPVVDAHNSLLAESEEEPTARLGALILEAIPQSTAIQVEHLLSQPLLIVEQLLMNSQMGVATDLIKVIRLNGADEDIEEMDKILLRYATKALALGLPEIPSSPPLIKDSSNARQTPKRKKNSAFAPPASVPPKDQWVADADVNQCPCCQTIQFSMFDRRHHCRRCGRVVCGACSPHRRLVDGYGDVPVRTCVDCHSTLHDRPSETLSAIRLPSQDGGGQLVWRLSLDAQHNHIARREFSYEHAPNLALALAMVHLCQCNETMANFLLDQSSSMLATLHRYLVHGTLMDVCSDPLMMFSLIKSLILGAKMRYSDIIAAPGQSKGKPSRGLARCDALLGQIDLLSLLVSANCLHLLPPQPMSQLDTWRKLRDRLIDIELWSLALDVSTKAGLDAGSVWAAWGLVCLKAGNFQGARQRFQRCLKPGKNSPLLQEILSVLESLSIPCASLPGNRNESSSGSSWTSKRTRKLSSPSSLPSPVFNCDNPQLIVASLTRLNDICAGHLVEVEDKNCIMEEILFYLENYGQPESPCAYLVEKSGRIDLAVHRFASSSSSRHQTSDVFNQGLLLPCLKSSKLEDLVIEMKRHDASFHSWKSHLLAAAQLLEAKCFWNSLYQLHCLSGDWIRASLVAIRRLYLNDLFSVETLVARSHLLEDVVAHLNQYLARQADLGDQGENDRQLPLWWPANEVISLQKTIQLQMKVTAFLDACLKEGKLSSSLLAVVKSVTQSPDGISGPSGDLNSSGVYLIPTLLGARQFRCSNAVLVACASPDAIAFELSWTICNDLRVRLDRFFRLTSFVLIRRGQVPALIQLVEFIKARMNSQSVGFFDMDELLVECATLVQERDKENRSPDLELIVHHIKKPASKIRGFINLGWLKAAYLLAVKNGQITDVIHIQQEATRLQQTAVLALCDKWLRARNVAK